MSSFINSFATSCVAILSEKLGENVIKKVANLKSKKNEECKEILSDHKSQAVCLNNHFGKNGQGFVSKGIKTGNVGGLFSAFFRKVSVALQKDGKIVVAGTVNNINTKLRDVIVTRFCPNGKLDKSFGNEGTSIISIGNIVGVNGDNTQPPFTDFGLGNSYAFDVKIQPCDQKIVICGIVITQTVPIGQIVTIVVTNPGSGFTSTPTIVITPDPVDVGAIPPTTTPIIQNGQLVAILLTSRGSGFTVEPTVTIIGGNGDATARAIISESDNGLLGPSVTGFATAFVTRLNGCSGKVDKDFGQNGVATLTLGPDLNGPTSAQPTSFDDLNRRSTIFFGLDIQKNGKIVVGGGTQTTAFPVTLFINTPPNRLFPIYYLAARFTRHGKLDKKFGPTHQGYTIIPITGRSFGENLDYNGGTSFGGIAIQCDKGEEKLVLAGNATNNNRGIGRDTAIIRLRNNGILDPTFNPGGKLGLNQQGTTSTSVPGIVVYAIPQSQITNFQGSTANQDPPVDLLDQGLRLRIQPWDQKIVVAGEAQYLQNTNTFEFFVLRLNRNAELDKSFNRFGYNIIANPLSYNGELGSGGSPSGIAFDSKKRIIITTNDFDPFNPILDRLGIVRLNENGTLNLNLRNFTLASPADNLFTDVIVNDQDKIVAVGHARNIDNNFLEILVSEFQSCEGLQI